MDYGCPLVVLGSNRCVPLTPLGSTGGGLGRSWVCEGTADGFGGSNLNFRCPWDIQEEMLNKQLKYMI